MKLQKHMKLGEFIHELKQYDPKTEIVFDFCRFVPDRINSYRGDYSQLAIGYKENGEENGEMTVGDLLELCQGALWKDFTGYKGGEYTMTESTLLYVANYGDSGSTAIVGIQDEDWCLFIQTAHVEPF